MSYVDTVGLACEGRVAVSGCQGETAKTYQPSVLVVDVAMVLVQRGAEPSMLGRELPQAHQAAWTLLKLMGVEPDTSACPCMACGGAELLLSDLNLVAGYDPELTGRPRTDVAGGDGDQR